MPYEKPWVRVTRCVQYSYLRLTNTTTTTTPLAGDVPPELEQSIARNRQKWATLPTRTTGTLSGESSLGSSLRRVAVVLCSFAVPSIMSVPSAVAWSACIRSLETEGAREH